MKKSSYLWGTALILLGVFLILNNIFHIEFFSMRYLWPLFILVPGLMFELDYFINHRNSGQLVPGGILTTIGVLFLFQVFTNYQYSSYTWPIYPLSIAIGLFQLYLHTDNSRGLLVPVFIIGGFSLVSLAALILKDFAPWFNEGLIFPAVLILVGIYVLVRKK